MYVLLAVKELKTACNQNQLMYCSHSKAHYFAQEILIDKIKVPFLSAMKVLSDCLIISVSTICGESVVYSERVTFFSYHAGWALVAPL